MNTKPFMFNFWVFVLVVATMLGLCGQTVYQSMVIENQRHTIRQYMGLEQGVDATPQPPKVPTGPEAPKPFTDQRRWQKAL